VSSDANKDELLKTYPTKGARLFDKVNHFDARTSAEGDWFRWDRVVGWARAEARWEDYDHDVSACMVVVRHELTSMDLVSFHTGQTKIGNDFSIAYPDWDKNVYKPFDVHLHKVFCE
jgi:hypothetical protein